MKASSPFRGIVRSDRRVIAYLHTTTILQMPLNPTITKGCWFVWRCFKEDTSVRDRFEECLWKEESEKWDWRSFVRWKIDYFFYEKVEGIGTWMVILFEE